MAHVQRGALLLGVALTAGMVHADAEVEAGRRLFTTVTPACSVCHALLDAGAQGAIGPSLDELKPDHQRVVTALRTGIGQMPAFAHLGEAQIQALARYVSTAAQ
ncbi:MAG: cytochrome c [Comamonadaceae bacterium]|nr:MAG: cytochrome c [Comamonadaceae bacterium]